MINQLFMLSTRRIFRELEQVRKDGGRFQDKAFRQLLTRGGHTSFGNEYHFDRIRTLEDFQRQVPLFTYDRTEPYMLRQVEKGERRVTWDKRIKWFALSSGTSSAKSKWVPISKESIHQGQYKAMKMALAQYIRHYPKSKLFTGRTLTMGGSRNRSAMVETQSEYGDLSYFLIRRKPFLSRFFSTPYPKIALNGNFMHKMDQIAELVPHQRLTAFAGVPSWNLMLLERILREQGKNNLLELWPHMELFIHGGISFAPYRERFRKLFPSDRMHYLETYNASEGFFAIQDLKEAGSMLLLPNTGNFYEFIPLARLDEALAGTYTDFDTWRTVKAGVNYALVITTNSGLWRYLIGDTLRFTSVNPHRMVITGRTQAFINAFGEELMVGGAEKALALTCAQCGAEVRDFTAAPVFMDGGKKGAHQWVVEFITPPTDQAAFSRALDQNLCDCNSDYEAKRKHTGAMDPVQVDAVQSGCFFRWMESRGKVGGQNKVPRLSPHRDYVEQLLALDKELRSAQPQV